MGVTKNAIAKNILFYRKKVGLSQNDIANKLGVSVPAVSKWENGSNSIDIDTLFELCNVLGVTINDMSNFNKGIPNEMSTKPHIIEAAGGGFTDEIESDNEIEYWREQVIRELYICKLDIRQLKELKALIQAFDRL